MSGNIVTKIFIAIGFVIYSIILTNHIQKTESENKIIKICAKNNLVWDNIKLSCVKN